MTIIVHSLDLFLVFSAYEIGNLYSLINAIVVTTTNIVIVVVVEKIDALGKS